MIQANSNLQAQQMLCQYWHNHSGDKLPAVWAVFTDTRGMVSWSTSKRTARKIGGCLNEFFWLVRIAA